ncbi:arsenosugar biosynthesis radical SAM (seleno)protein ArsS [Desulfatirhabdium butyrativorans]|uniref:arsenosugar biosynthesis radical SAM (seleno)protein ArsS n=1 Tax=Desulfatirhabdium butyrativorans TaxID=340467 RepID=UPI00041B33A5|nr:arsenosugar biosynthesis radical SAM (seleno)protein ArsS [Desulfatirhabdium butyrativorans]
MQLMPPSHPADDFAERLRACGLAPLRSAGIEILQMNITRQCNLSCKHCHVQAGPDRAEMMSRETMTNCMTAAAHPNITTIDITGGAPELHPELEWLLGEAAGLKKRLIVRSNLVVMLDPAYRRYLDIFAAHKVELVASLPDYHPEKSDRQRGAGSFAAAIEVIRDLNHRSYGLPGSGLMLHLVHNPVGAYLPGLQSALEVEYRRVLRDQYGLHFNTLFCLVNNPIGRYAEYLKRSGNWSDYMRTLQCAFNIQTVGSLMCRTMLSIGWDGRLYDCDFNQMLDLTVNSGAPNHIENFDYHRLAEREVVVRSHCFACTAGAGSSCQGALTS